MNRIKQFTGTTYMRSYLIVIISILILAAATQSREIAYQGRLSDGSNQPVADGNYLVTFFIYNDPVAGNVVWAETAEITTTEGMFSHNLGSITPFGSRLFQLYSELYLELNLNNEPITPRTKLTTTPFAISAENLNAYDSSGIASMMTDVDKHQFILYDSVGEPAIIFQDKKGDSSVVLPPFAVNAEEILNEPGVAADINYDLITLQTGEMQDLARLSVIIPDDGIIVLYGKCYLLLSGTTGPNTALVQIDEREGGNPSFPYYSIAGLSGYVNSGTNYFPVFVTRIYHKTKGQYFFRLEGKALMELPAVAQSWDHVLTAVYYPTSYEATYTISKTPMGDPDAVPIVIDSSTPNRPAGTYYKVDLQKIKMLDDNLEVKE